MDDAPGLLDGICKVSQVGRADGYWWRERYHPDGKGGVIPAGPDKYCEYPANLIRIVQRFLFGVDLQVDGSLVLRPTATVEFWERGFGQTVVAGNRKLSYRMQRGRTEGTYHGTAPLRLGLRFPPDMVPIPDGVLVNGRPVEMVREQDLIFLVLQAASPQEPSRFEVAWSKPEALAPREAR
jgi:hypothetical protein